MRKTTLLALMVLSALAACSSPTAPAPHEFARPYPIRPTPIACDSCTAPTVRP